MVNRPHVIFVHEAVFLTDEQRAAADAPANPADRIDVDAAFAEDEFDPFEMNSEQFFGAISDDVQVPVNTMLRERRLTYFPYRTNAERAIIASGFLEDNERHLLFRLYVPSGRLYAQEAEALLGLFREWLVEKGHNRVRQEGYSTAAGQVFEFFSAEAQAEGGLRRYFKDFSSFLEVSVSSTEAAIAQLIGDGCRSLRPKSSCRGSRPEHAASASTSCNAGRSGC